MSKNNTNNLNGYLIKQNNTCHSQYDKKIHYYYNMSNWTKKSFSRMTHKDIKLTNHKTHFLLQNESLLMAWKLALILFTTQIVHPSLNEISFLCNHLMNST
jgi:hypothetical protein